MTESWLKTLGWGICTILVWAGILIGSILVVCYVWTGLDHIIEYGTEMEAQVAIWVVIVSFFIIWYLDAEWRKH